MWQFIVGLITGAGVVLAKDYLVPNKEKQKLQSELNSVLDENEKFRKRSKESECLVEDLQSEVARLKKQSQNREDAHDDLQDDLDAEKRKNKQLSA